MTSETGGTEAGAGEASVGEGDATERIVYVDRSAVREGAIDDLEPAMAELVDFVAANEPDILAYDVYFSADKKRMTVIHAHADQASLEHHLAVAGPKFPPIGAFIDLESIDVYGRLSDDLVRRLREKAAELGSGRVSVHDHHRGVGRRPEETVRDGAGRG